ncbi:MAG: helicase-associated domain-containing protein [Treponema sp.]|jgi:hypothetical protein|nr:helicase-associated domain-containing protein [Treponema sp.]
MKRAVFRPVKFWKSAVMTMPDNSFHELLRNVFGKIKTPFNKQQLINDLEQFLLRDDIQKTIAGYIDRNDAKIIAAVALLGEPAPGELDRFFSGELSYAQLQDIIVNLEERFVLYRSDGGHLALNPVLEQALLPFASDISPLFPVVPAGVLSAETVMTISTVLNDRILAGVYSFVSQNESFFRAEGILRKRILELGKECFPGIDLRQILGSMQLLGLLYTDNDKLVPDIRRFNDFGSLSARERMEYCAAGIMIASGGTANGTLPLMVRGKIRETAFFIHRLLDSLDAEQLYPEKTLSRLIEIAKDGLDEINIDTAFFESLEKTGLLEPVSNELRRPGPAAEQKKAGPFIAIDSGFSVLVYPEIAYNDAIALASVLNIREAGPVVRFELNRDSAVRAFDRNIYAEEIIELLRRLSDGRVDDSLVWTLKDWEKRYKEVSLRKGVILSLSEDRRYLTETRALAGIIKETLAPGLYLLPENAMDKAANLLHSAGIDIVARKTDSDTGHEAAYNYFPPPSSRGFSEKKQCAAAVQKAEISEEAASTQIAAFHAILEKIPLGKAEQVELAARIDRRLILCETQLKDAHIRYEKLEARHLDYAGKHNIARQAIAQQSPVEVYWPGEGKNGERIFGIPKALEKKEGELIMVIVPADASSDTPADASGEVLRIPLGKISLLRRIKRSIFEN